MMQTIRESAKDIPLVGDFDVAVVGGGPAGIAAAIAAARNGARVILVESRGFLGGMMTEGNAGLTRYIVHVKDSDDKRKVVAQLATEPSSVQIVGGIPLEITHRLMEMGAAIGTNGTAGNYVFTAQQDFKWLLLKMMEEAGVKLLLHSLIVDVIKDGDDIRGIIVENKSGRQAVLGKIVVDATGDGDVAAKAGAPFVLGVGPDDLKIKELEARLNDGMITEVILATNPNTEGEATAMYLHKLISPLNIRVTRLARGLPFGADLEYADDVTLSRALEGRQEI